jgi:biotin carboxylase
MQRHAVIVNPHSTGRDYAPAFRAAGVEPVAVLTRSSGDLSAGGWNPADFARVHVHAGSDLADLPALSELAAELAAYRPLCIVPGAETGVELADALTELVLPGTGNVPALSQARRDKGQMAEAVRRAGIPHLRQVCTDRTEVVLDWLAETGLAGSPLVLKPPKSAGTDDVHLVPPDGDWKAVFDEILGRVNKLGLRNEAVLVEEFADGVEYLVDSYSVDGRHGLVDVCRYTKRSRGDRIGIYQRVDFLPPDDPGVREVWPYTQRVLDAVGIRTGCGHAEVMLTAAGPRLMEVAARPAGGGHQLISALATGDNHIQRTVRHRVHGEMVDGYDLVRYVCGAFISAPQAGIWRNAEVFAEVESLPTFHAKNFPFGTGDTVAATEDIYTYLAWVILASADPAAVQADHRRLAEMERQIRIDPVAAGG